MVLLLTGACSDRSTQADLVFINGAEPQTLDPALISGQLEGRLSYCLFEGLTRHNLKGEAIPGIAERWEISPDRRTYTFHLRSDAFWSNGDPVTAGDFVDSWRRVLEPSTDAVYAEILFFIENAEAYQKGKITDFNLVGIKAPDSKTVQVRLTSPTPFFIDLTAFTTYLPVHMPSVRKFGESWARPGNMVCNGPFLLKDWRINDRVIMVRNERYWDAAHVALRRVDALATSQGNTALNLYLTGEADLLLDKGLIPSQILPELRKRRDFHVFNFLGSYFYRFNTTRPPFNNPLVRKAFSASIDRNVIVQKITRGGEAPARSLVPEGISGYQPYPGIDYNPEQARKWLAEAGYPGGKKFPSVSIMYNASQQHAAIAVEVQAMWKRELGVDVELRQQDWPTYLRDMDLLNFDVVRSSWVGDYADPNTFLDCFVTGRGNNRTGWSNPRYDQLLGMAGVESNPQKRFDDMREAEKLLVSEYPPIAPLYFYVGMLCYDPDRLGGIEGNILDEHPIRTIYRKDAK